jgi:hypothetical protein
MENEQASSERQPVRSCQNNGHFHPEDHKITLVHRLRNKEDNKRFLIVKNGGAASDNRTPISLQTGIDPSLQWKFFYNFSITYGEIAPVVPRTVCRKLPSKAGIEESGEPFPTCPYPLSHDFNQPFKSFQNG